MVVEYHKYNLQDRGRFLGQNKIFLVYIYIYIFPGGAVVKNPPPIAGDARAQVQSLIWEDPLEKEMATHSNILS